MSIAVDVVARRDSFAVEAAFEAAAGETVALLGPNGSGKSTLVATIAGLLSPVRGRIELEGSVLDDAVSRTHVAPERRPVGVVFQDLLLFPHLSALENVAFPLRARGVARSEAHRRAIGLLGRFDVDQRAHARPSDLSGGEAQRVALARALVAQPKLLLLDEPLSALDVGARTRIRDLLREELRRFPGVRIIVTHDPVEATTLADRLDRLGDGSGAIVTDGGRIVVAWPDWYERGDVIGVLRPPDVTLSIERPTGSARNVLRGAVRSVVIDGQRARVRLATSPELIAEITAGSVERLGLRDGVEIWASFKAVEVDVHPL